MSPVIRSGIVSVLLAALAAIYDRPAFAEIQFQPATRIVIAGSSNDEQLPTLSSDNLTLVFTSSTRNAGRTDNDLYQASRAIPSGPFGSPVNLSAVNSASSDLATGISYDGLSLYLASDRPGGQGGIDVWASTRSSTDVAFGSPVNLGTSINTRFLDGGPNISKDGLTLMFNSSRDTNGNNRDIDMAKRATTSSPFGAVEKLDVSSAFDDARPSLSADGLLMFFMSDRPGGFGNCDIWMTRRESLTAPWSVPTNLGPNVNGPADDLQPNISWDGTQLLFASDRTGDYHLYQSAIVPEPSCCGVALIGLISIAVKRRR